MRFSLTTWNINSVRLRIDIVAKFLKSGAAGRVCACRKPNASTTPFR